MMTITRSPYDITADGQAVDQFSVANSRGVSFRLITYGATLTSVKVPDRKGQIGEITLGFDSLQSYEGDHPFFGATVGRFANRIANGRFHIGETEYLLEKNNKGIHHLHGGTAGFNRRVWEAFPIKKEKEAGITLTLSSPDGDQGYPGKLDVRLDVMLSEENELSLKYEAMVDAPCPVNLTNHTYWNLAGECGGEIGGHVVRLNSPGYLEVDDTLIPTGNIIPVEGTPFDFTSPTQLSERLQLTGGFDHCFTLSMENALSIPAAEIYEPESGRRMSVFTISPGIQFYTGNFLNSLATRCGRAHPHHAFCLETEEYPDAMNHSNFPEAILKPKEHYLRKTVYQFGVKD